MGLPGPNRPLRRPPRRSQGPTLGPGTPGASCFASWRGELLPAPGSFSERSGRLLGQMLSHVPVLPPRTRASVAAPFRGRRGRGVPRQVVAAEHPPRLANQIKLIKKKNQKKQKKKEKKTGAGGQSPPSTVFGRCPRRVVWPRPALPGAAGPVPTRRPHREMVLFWLSGLVRRRRLSSRRSAGAEPPREPVPAVGGGRAAAAPSAGSPAAAAGRRDTGEPQQGHRHLHLFYPPKKKPRRQRRELRVPLACARARSLL